MTSITKFQAMCQNGFDNFVKNSYNLPISGCCTSQVSVFLPQVTVTDTTSSEDNSVSSKARLILLEIAPEVERTAKRNESGPLQSEVLLDQLRANVLVSDIWKRKVLPFCFLSY